MKQTEFKKRYDPELGRFTRQHIYGEGVMDVFKHLKRLQKLLQQKQLQQQLQKLVNMLEKKKIFNDKEKNPCSKTSNFC